MTSIEFEAKWNQAIEDLTFGIIHLSKDIKFTIADTTTNNYSKFSQEKELVISREGCATSIYGNVYINILARAWHDTLHIKHHKGFTIEDETLIAKIQRNTMFNTLVLNAIPKDRAEIASTILFIDIYEQVKFYYENNKFVDSQIEFVKTLLSQYLLNNLKTTQEI